MFAQVERLFLAHSRKNALAKTHDTHILLALSRRNAQRNHVPDALVLRLESHVFRHCVRACVGVPMCMCGWLGWAWFDAGGGEEIPRRGLKPGCQGVSLSVSLLSVCILLPQRVTLRGGMSRARAMSVCACT